MAGSGGSAAGRCRDSAPWHWQTSLLRAGVALRDGDDEKARELLEAVLSPGSPGPGDELRRDLRALAAVLSVPEPDRHEHLIGQLLADRPRLANLVQVLPQHDLRGTSAFASRVRDALWRDVSPPPFDAPLPGPEDRHAAELLARMERLRASATASPALRRLLARADEGPPAPASS